MKAASLTSSDHEFAPSELVLDARGAAYHIGVRPEELADTILIAGDPGRIKRISSLFDSIEFKHENREFVTHTGVYKGNRISALATGIGTDNIDIVINELDALANIDLDTRRVKAEPKSLRIIRLGTCGALQSDTPVDTLVVSEFAVGLDNVCEYYDHELGHEEMTLRNALLSHLGSLEGIPEPYVVKGDEDLILRMAAGAELGITLTASGFYGPQGRQLRLRPRVKDLNTRFANFNHGNKRILNYEMETSALYGLGSMLGHQCATVCTVIANRKRKEYSKDHHSAIASMIDHVMQGLFK